MKFKIISFLLVLFSFFFSCGKKDKTILPGNDYSYFPTNAGHEIIYAVDSISKSAFKLSTDTFHFQMREVIESIYTDNEGRPTLRLERYRRSDESQPWEIFKVWTANVTKTTAEKEEDNITFIKLVFPITLNEEWNGNIKNDLKEQQYRYASVNSPEKCGSLNFDSALTVIQKEVDDLVTVKEYEIEKFAAHAGMFYKESFKGSYKSPMPPVTTLQDSLEEYTHYTEKIISFSN